MKIVAILMISLSVISCGTKKNASKNTDASNGIKVTAVEGELAKESDPIMSVDTAYIVDNTLFVDLTYSGGCEKHDFKVIGSLAIAKSYPPIRAVQIVHNANGDSCREVKKASLEIDVTAIAYQQKDGSEIYFTLDGWNDRIYYKYVSKK